MEGTENYAGLETTAKVTIEKEVPVFRDEVAGLNLAIGKGQALETIQLPDGFAWSVS